jgi:serine O-acetyltransferase
MSFQPERNNIDKYPDINGIVDAFTEPPARGSEPNIPRRMTDMPSLAELEKMMRLLRSAIFPGFFGPTWANDESWKYHLASSFDEIFRTLTEQIRLGICFSDGNAGDMYERCGESAIGMACDFMKRLPAVRELLDGDALAAYEGDPAAKSKAETIFCYPSVRIMTNHRIAHELHRLSVPVIPRIISEMGHSDTGIDIHPAASIGEEFFIDHGTGVVIGETAIIGNHCRLYQGVTLGALSFPKDPDGVLIKGMPRHPILEDNVTVYSGTTILGRVTIGAGSVIGGNVWITEDVPPGSKIVQQRSVAPSGGDDLLGKKE